MTSVWRPRNTSLPSASLLGVQTDFKVFVINVIVKGVTNKIYVFYKTLVQIFYFINGTLVNN